ncbi:MAG: TonB-dependent receptor [Acidobacteria bacterium]|nr:TonB-dependent receptor [Acidobacteriota bacterium]MCA1610729.1 TonB-dependent receptor [Acidobacteriota bacterium]
MTHGTRLVCAAIVWALRIATIVTAQEAPSLRGRVTDGNGSALPGVTVEARVAGRPAVPVTSTDRQGAWRIDGLPVGNYSVSFRLPGFASVTREKVSVGESVASLDVALHLSVTADVVVTGKRTFRNLADVENPTESLLGVANAATDGAITARQIDERPILRPAEVLETVPGLVISQHSGEGKANQYYLRGFNLDHGTDFATSVAGIPANMPSHAHGQGYSDLNFLIPELVTGVQFQKGPYGADEGDFSTAGSANVVYANFLEHSIARVGGGSEGYGRALFAQSPKLGAGTLLYALEVTRNDGPWVQPDDMRKYNGVLRYSVPNEDGAFSITAMGYQNKWNSTDQVAKRAISSGYISRYGAIDPTDGGETRRYSLSADWERRGTDSVTRVTGYAVDYRLKLTSNFTYFLDDPVNGDQFQQRDRRIVTGLKANHQWLASFFGMEAENTVGVQLRNDNIAEDGLFHTKAREILETTRLDHVTQSSGSLYAQTSLRLGPKVRTILGLRGDLYRFHVASDNPANSGDETASLASPKVSLILGPWANTEFYANFGYGFHSNDARGSTITQDPRTGEPVDRVTPLVRAKGAEIGIRSVLVPHLQSTLSLWGLEIGSELVFTGDAGTTEASRPSRRSGLEWANYYSPTRDLTFDVDLAASRARFRDFDPVGDRVPGAIETVVSAGATVNPGAGVFGSIRLRYFGPRPLVEDNSVRSRSSTIVNTQLGYELVNGLRIGIDVFNVLNARVSDIDYFYASRLPGEAAEGVNDIHTHPAEPRSARAFVSYGF